MYVHISLLQYKSVSFIVSSIPGSAATSRAMCIFNVDTFGGWITWCSYSLSLTSKDTGSQDTSSQG